MLPSSTLRFVSEAAGFSSRPTRSHSSSHLLHALFTIHPALHRPLTYSLLRRGLAARSSIFSHFLFNDRDKTSLNASKRHFHKSLISFSHYDTLGIPSTASQSEVKDAFYRLSKQLHPDRNPDSPNAAEKFKLVSAAYEVIGNPENRRKYDGELRPELRRRESRDFGDPESGPGFSSVRGKQWRGGYDRSSGYRRTAHDEAFDRMMRDFENRYEESRRVDFEKRQWDEWYKQHYKEQQDDHPFWEHEKARREQQWAEYNQAKSEAGKQKESRADKSYNFGTHPYERAYGRRYGPQAHREMSRRLLRSAIFSAFLTWLILDIWTRKLRQENPGPRYFSGESVGDVRRDDFIRRYYDQMADKDSKPLNAPVSDNEQDQSR